MRFLPPTGALLAALALLAGCAPTTTYRHTAYVPAVRPIPFDGRTAEMGTMRIEGTVTGSTIAPDLFPQVGDTAVFVPRYTAEGSVMIAATPNVEIGARAAYASYSWGQASATGTMPLPNAPSSWGAGPEMRLAFPVTKDKRLAIGIAGNLMYYTVPYAEWQLDATSGQCAVTSTCGYSLANTGSDGHFVYSLGLYPSYAFGRDGQYGHVFGLVAATNGFSNDGFTNTQSSGSTVNAVGPIAILGGGYGVSYQWLRASATAFLPMTTSSSPVDYGLGVMLTVGVNLDLGWRRPDGSETPPAGG
ncbi:MAG TPA: hypothetical protein VGL81_30480 [Polyangiaceae bacterium]|jgi:hypothetical protein